MSVYSGKTSLSSILKCYSPAERDKAKNAIINKVRFEIPKQKGVLGAVHAVCEDNNYAPMNEFVNFLCDCKLDDLEFTRLMRDIRTVVDKLSPKFSHLVEHVIALDWIKRNAEAKIAYAEFLIDLVVAHSKYIKFAITALIKYWIPADADILLWPNGRASATMYVELQAVHKLLERMLIAIPMAFESVVYSVEKDFPYLKKASHVVAGYVYNMLWLLEYQPIYTDVIMQMLMEKLVVIDVNAPRAEIEEAEYDDDDENGDMDDETIFEMDDCKKEINVPTAIEPMKHMVAQTLDYCMENVFIFLDGKNPNSSNLNDAEKNQRQTQFFKVLLQAFDRVILPKHDTHHVQFFIFYYCSFKTSLAETFLCALWDKVQNPNVSAVIRQASVGYVASFLARSKFVSIITLKHYLKELCNWAHQYIQRGDQYRSNGSLKANVVFFSVCQGIFYVISFRSRDLTVDKKSLLFLQSLQLSALVNCNLNPLRVCLPAVATAFAGVTRAYQLAYCHAILERNARRKLATVYANDISTPMETLETFFPFDPYLLKMSALRITPHYLQYQASDAEEHSTAATAIGATTTMVHDLQMRRKRGDSEMLDDHDVDDFLFSDKRQKFAELARSQEREAQFTYGLSPGFHI